MKSINYAVTHRAAATAHANKDGGLTVGVAGMPDSGGMPDAR